MREKERELVELKNDKRKIGREERERERELRKRKRERVAIK